VTRSSSAQTTCVIIGGFCGFFISVNVLYSSELLHRYTILEGAEKTFFCRNVLLLSPRALPFSGGGDPPKHPCMRPKARRQGSSLRDLAWTVCRIFACAQFRRRDAASTFRGGIFSQGVFLNFFLLCTSIESEKVPSSRGLTHFVAAGSQQSQTCALRGYDSGPL
jgi:hypothetical protein